MKITLEQFKKFANDNEILWFYNKPVWRTTPMDVDSKEFRKYNKEQLDEIRRQYKGESGIDTLPYWMSHGNYIEAMFGTPEQRKKDFENKKREESMKVNVEIAKICHEANRQYCIDNQLKTHAKWDELPDTMQESVIAGVAKIIDNPKITAEEMHEAWMEYKAEEGWIYGDEVDVPGKEHPNMVEWKKLSKVERGKDKLFLRTVLAEMKT